MGNRELLEATENRPVIGHSGIILMQRQMLGVGPTSTRRALEKKF